MTLIDGVLLHLKGIVSRTGQTALDVDIKLCHDCAHHLEKKKTRPPLSLARGTWVGDVPPEISSLTLPERLLIATNYTFVQVIKLCPKTFQGGDPQQRQRGIKGTCSTFRQNTPEVIRMLEGKLLPHPTSILYHVLSVAFIGKARPLKTDLKPKFSISRIRVLRALQWLRQHNHYYADYDISQSQIDALPVDDIPTELLDLMRCSDNEHAARVECANYTNQANAVEESG